LKNNIEVIGKIIINYNEKKIFKIIDLLKNGLNIKLIIGIDFTLLNGKVHILYIIIILIKTIIILMKIIKKLIHYYEKSIRYFDDILSYYNNDQLFPVFGFVKNYLMKIILIFIFH
jgi:hypothetical protein